MKESANIENITNIIVQTVMPERVYLFGSYAEGTPTTDSDYDFYVVVPDDGERPLLLTERIHNALFTKTGGKPVDILVKRASDFESRKALPTIEREVSTKGVLVYATI